MCSFIVNVFLEPGNSGVFQSSVTSINVVKGICRHIGQTGEKDETTTSEEETSSGASFELALLPSLLGKLLDESHGIRRCHNEGYALR